MKIEIEHIASERPQFNVSLYGKSAHPFITIKGCRIVEGSNGKFVSWPATKNQTTGKYWHHVWASDAFAAEVLRLADKPTSPVNDDDIPF